MVPHAIPWFAPPETHASSRHATVVGAGLAGVSIACHLRMLGWQVTLIDRHKQLAQGTSGNPAGLIKPQVNSNNIIATNYYNNYFQYFTKYFKKLLEIDPEIQHGLNDLSNKPKPPIPGTFPKTSAWVSPRDFCHAQLNMHLGIKTLYNNEVEALKNESDRWQCVSSDGEILSDTEVCILASGYEINFLLGKHPLSIEPLAGQISLLSEKSITPPVTQAHYHKHYLIPLNDNSYVCGASHHRYSALDENQIDHDENLAGLEQLLPHHHIDKTQLIGGRTGIRAVSPDHLPIIGGMFDEVYYRSEYESLHHGKRPELYAPAKYQKGLFVMGALGSHGIGNSPYLGKLLSELINGSTDNKDQQILQLLHPSRFLIRDLKRKPVDRKWRPE